MRRNFSLLCRLSSHDVVECRRRVAGVFSRCYTGAPWSQRLTVRYPPPVTGGVCLATRVRYRQSCGLDTWSALLAYLFVSRICVAGLCFCIFALVLCFIFSPPLRSDRGRLSRLLFFSSLSLLLFVFLDVAMVRKGKPAFVTTGSRDRTYVRK